MTVRAPEVTLSLGLDDAEDPEAIARSLAKKLARPVSELPPFEIRRRSIDARRGRIRIHLLVEIDPEPAEELALRACSAPTSSLAAE